MRKPVTLIVIRHGERQDAISGVDEVDTALTEGGTAKVAGSAKLLKSILDRHRINVCDTDATIHSSPFRRTLQTAVALREGLEALYQCPLPPITVDPNLSEVFGTQRIKSPTPPALDYWLQVQPPVTLPRSTAEAGLEPCAWGEDVPAAHRRMTRAFATHAHHTEASGGGVRFLVTHGDALQAVMSYVRPARVVYDCAYLGFLVLRQRTPQSTWRVLGHDGLQWYDDDESGAPMATPPESDDDNGTAAPSNVAPVAVDSATEGRNLRAGTTVVFDRPEASKLPLAADDIESAVLDVSQRDDAAPPIPEVEKGDDDNVFAVGRNSSLHASPDDVRAAGAVVTDATRTTPAASSSSTPSEGRGLESTNVNMLTARSVGSVQVSSEDITEVVATLHTARSSCNVTPHTTVVVQAASQPVSPDMADGSLAVTPLPVVPAAAAAAISSAQDDPAGAKQSPVPTTTAAAQVSLAGTPREGLHSAAGANHADLATPNHQDDGLESPLLAGIPTTSHATKVKNGATHSTGTTVASPGAATPARCQNPSRELSPQATPPPGGLHTYSDRESDFEKPPPPRAAPAPARAKTPPRKTTPQTPADKKKAKAAAHPATVTKAEPEEKVSESCCVVMASHNSDSSDFAPSLRNGAASEASGRWHVAINTSAPCADERHEADDGLQSSVDEQRGLLPARPAKKSPANDWGSKWSILKNFAPTLWTPCFFYILSPNTTVPAAILVVSIAVYVASALLRVRHRAMCRYRSGDSDSNETDDDATGYRRRRSVTSALPGSFARCVLVMGAAMVAQLIDNAAGSPDATWSARWSTVARTWTPLWLGLWACVFTTDVAFSA